MRALISLLSIGGILLFCSAPILASDEKEPEEKKVKGPDVVLIESERKSIQEFRHNGRLVMIKVVPKKGKPYYLVPEDPTKHFGDLERAERLVPKWILKRF